MLLCSKASAFDMNSIAARDMKSKETQVLNPLSDWRFADELFECV